MRKKDAQIEKLGEVLEKSLQRLDLSGKLTEYGIWPIWNDTVGPAIARNAQPEKIRHGTLFVKVSSPAWMQQLQYVKEMITERLNQGLGREVVKNIFFVVGKVKPQELSSAEPTGARRGAPPLSESSKLDEEPLSSVCNPETRDALKKLFSAYSRKRKA